MAKISPVAAKYIVHSTITIDGVVDKPDVIGAIFGQTEGLLGADLELRELQRSGRIGRIEVNMNTTSGKTNGEIIIPSSLDKTETAIVAAALEIIQRIGPCNAKIEVHKIEDVRTSKRQFVIERAKELLRELTDTTLPDSQELADEVSQSVRMMEVMEYGRERIAAGPAIDESEEIIIVEGRADVLCLLKHGFKNVIALNGTSVPQVVKELTAKKTCTIFVDGDRGGDLIIREMFAVADVDFVCKAPDGKEVEELTKKEIHKALRGRITAEQAKLDLGIQDDGTLKEDIMASRQSKTIRSQTPSAGMFTQGNHQNQQTGLRRQESQTSRQDMPLPRMEYTRPQAVSVANIPSRAAPMSASTPPQTSGSQTGSQAIPVNAQRTTGDKKATADEKKIFRQTMDDLLGTRGACLFDAKLTILGKVPLSELTTTIKSLNGGIYALALDGAVDLDLLRLAEKLNITYLIGSSSKVKEASKVQVLTDEKLV